MTSIIERKSQHLDAVLAGDVDSRIGAAGFDAIAFEHVALPEIDLDKIDITTSLAGRPMKAPLLISSMTGGPAMAHQINGAIAEAAGHLGIGFGVGSQRIALECGNTAGFDRALRQRAGNVPIFANFGAAQLRAWSGTDMAQRAIDMIDADGLIIHLNPLQEAVQAEGDRNWSGILKHLEALARVLPQPIVVKEVGSGLSGQVARQLWNSGIRILDVAGSGGTSWAAVEAERAPNARQRATAMAFRDWGIPTPASIVAVRQAAPEATIIASGGIRNGIDAAKSIRLGADVAAQAAGVLKAAVAGPDAIIDHFASLIDQLRIACFCTGSATLSALRQASLQQPLVIPGPGSLVST